MAERLKRALRPASPSPEFKERLRQRLHQEARDQASHSRRPVWQTPWIWGTAAAAALGLILAFLIVPLFSTATGTLVIRITDAKPQDRTVTEVNILVERIDVHLAGDADTDNGSWINVFEGSYETDLLELAGVTDTIGSKEVPAGKYTQIRIQASGVSATVNDVETVPLEIPSNELKMINVPDFDVAEDSTTVLTIDFDIEQSMFTHAADKIILQPVIKLEVTGED